jgi:UDP-2-acetamido-2-deoxy-ribo-hexuluronate aminotransferase
MKFPIQMYDPTRTYHEHKSEFDKILGNIINDGLFIGGPHIKDLETKLSNYTGAKNAITCANGTDAIFIVLKALDIGNNDEVITVAHTWISTAETIAMTGAKPVFVDIMADNFNINPELITSKININTKAILFVSLYGLMPDCSKLMEIAQQHNLYLIEDGAQSFGAEYNNTKSCSCKYTTLATTSFFPSKPLGCWGDGGAIFTNDDLLAQKIRAIKSHGGTERFKHKYIGMNSRLDTIQAGILLVKMEYFDKSISARNRCAHYYTDKLAKISELTKPSYDTSIYTHAWAQYSLLCQNITLRNKLVNYLKDNGVNVAIFYPVGLHKQECFQYLGNNYLPTTELVCDTVINLPCYAEITVDEQDYIINLIYKFFDQE